MQKTTSTIEQALLMYKETVSPTDKGLQDLLSQIPEQIKKEPARAIRSPYIWVTITQVVTVCCILLVLYPSITVAPSSLHDDNPFYLVDQQVETFEQTIDTEDGARVLLDYNL